MTKKIFSAAINIHDHNTYDGVFHNQIERHNRRKHNLNPENSHDHTPSKDFFKDHVEPNFKKRDENNIFAFTVSNLGQEFVADELENLIPKRNFLDFYPANLWDRYERDNYYYIDHHQSHATYALLTSNFNESDILAIDGRGWQFNCIFVDRKGKIKNLSHSLSIGGLWNRLAQDLGFGYLGAGKVMGLAGFGKYNYQTHAMIEYYLENPNHKLPEWSKTVIDNNSKEDIAYTLQYVTTELIKEHVYPLKTCNNICVAGGVAYNGYMNEQLTKHYKRVHVPPAIGDEGQSIGTYMHADMTINGNTHKPNTYAGKAHGFNTAIFNGLKFQQKPIEIIYLEVARAIADGAIVGWYQGKSESGNRALGNRSILADPRNPDIKDIINSKIKKREDFRPFAPSVLEEHYKDYFDTNQPSPYMSRIMPVKSDKIPGVTHVDGTARIQTVSKPDNPIYYNLIKAFYDRTGIPMLLNTSFNCQEPIVETPEDAVNTFKNTELDILVIRDFIIKK